METPPPEDDFAEPANLRFLRRLVTVLTAVMIGGVLLILALLVIRFPQAPTLPLPDDITLPDGAAVQAVTWTEGRYLVLTHDNRLLVFDAGATEPGQVIQIEPAPDR